MKPSTRAARELLLSREWVSGNDLFEVAGTRYGARLDELKLLGYRWEKRWIKGSAVPLYHLLPPEPEQQTMGLAS
ncbi:MAG: hypothetical protein LC798_11195 [Chloroflexi bacterium]|nr:hypothetical protein [Chloroflexota bacterium]